MSKLLAYLERYFPAHLWDPIGVKDAGDDDPGASRSGSNGNQFRRKNHIKSHEIGYLPSIGEGERWNEDDVRRTFMENFGVSVRIVADPITADGECGSSAHFLFKYYVILQAKSTWLDDVTGVLGDCRGTIMRCVKGQSWKIASRPFEKFFNQQEIACPVYTAAKFDEHVSEYEFVEKADGTMMVLWHRHTSPISPEEGHWQWSTTTGLLADVRWVRAVTPFLHVRSAVREIEHELVDRDANHNFLDEARLDKTRTYIFELCSRETRVITTYESDRIYLIGALDTASGDHATQAELDAIAQSFNIMRPTRHRASEVGIHSLQAALQWVEEQANNGKGTFGAWPEGYVVYHRDKPICKLKNRAYNDRHAFYASDLLHMRNLMVERYFAGTTDDVLAFCPPPIVAFTENMTEKVQNLLNMAVSEQQRLVASLKLLSKPIDEPSLVEFLRADPLIQHHGFLKFFLKHKQLLMRPEQFNNAQIKEIYMAWLDQNWKSLLDYWRSTTVPELIEEDRVRDKERIKSKKIKDSPSSSSSSPSPTT